MTAEDRIELLIKPLINDWLDLARGKCGARVINIHKKSYQDALFDLSRQLHEAITWERN